MTGPRTWAGALAAVLLGTVLWWAQGTGTPERGAPADADALPVVALADLPPEAADTVALVDAGGPFPHEQDDGTFFNREGLLPEEDEGFYREYTVETPGSGDRGARRVVAGADGVLYWTDDHYASFSRIDRTGE